MMLDHPLATVLGILALACLAVGLWLVLGER